MQKNDLSSLLDLDINDVEYLVCHVSMLWRKLIGAKIKSLGINITEKRVLFCIARNPGLTQVQIANLLELEPQNLIRSLDKLEKLNCLEKRSDLNDRRVKCIYITPSATKMISKIKKISENVKPQILAELDEKKVHSVIHHLSHIRENLFRELVSTEGKK